MLSCGIYNEDGRAWNKFVTEHPAATNYHLWEWKAVVEESFGHPCCYLAANDHRKGIVGILPLVHMQSRLFGNFLVSLPFFNYGGLLCSTPAAETGLLSMVEELIQQTGVSHLELRHVGSGINNLVTKTHKVTMILDLCCDVDSQWKAFNAKLRNQIRKAEKNGLKVVVGGVDLLDGFYDVFCRNMRDLGTPVYGKNFFYNILANFPESSRIISVTHNGKVIASGIASWFGDTIEIPWASSNKDFKALCPNNMLYWEAIRFAIKKGFKKFDFGRSTPGEGTYKFKEQWGAKPVPLFWQYLLADGSELPEINTKNPKYEMAITIWQKLPVWLTRAVGPRIVRSIP